MSYSRRDRDRSVAYNAERHWYTGTPMGERADFDALVTATRAIEATPEWQAVTNVPLTLGYNGGDRSYAQGSIISYVLNGHRSTVPHEMAHVITPSDVGHGHLWRSTFVWVVRLAYGNDWADSLARAFTTSKLSVDVLPLERRLPVFPPETIAVNHGGPLLARKAEPARGAIAL